MCHEKLENSVYKYFKENFQKYLNKKMLQKILPQKTKFNRTAFTKFIAIFKNKSFTKKHIKCGKQNMIILWKMNTKKILSRNFK